MARETNCGSRETKKSLIFSRDTLRLEIDLAGFVIGRI